MNTTPNRYVVIGLASSLALVVFATCGGGPGSDPNNPAYLFAAGGSTGDGGGTGGTGGSSGTNMLVGVAHQSSTGWDGFASRAADGNTNGNYLAGSVTHTLLETNPWWESHTHRRLPSRIAIYNRTDCCGERLGQFWVSFLKSSDGQWADWGPFQIRPDSLSLELFVPNDNPFGTVDRVRITKNGTGYLSLAEVQLHAR